MLEKRHEKLVGCISFEIADELVLQRIAGRRIHEQSGRTYNIYFKPPKVADKDDETGEALIIRKDDAEATVKRRLVSYHKEYNALAGYYKQKGLFRSINAEQHMDKVYQIMKRIYDKNDIKA